MIAPLNRTPLFPLGRLLATPGAIEALQATKQSPAEFLSRHVTGDFGCVCEEDKRLNQAAVENGSRILSAYLLSDGTKIWVITEAADARGDRAATTILLPDEY